MTDLFDLQRFADGDGGDVPADAGSNPDTGETAPADAGEEKGTEGSAEGAKSDTILGGKSTPNVPDAYDFKSIVPEGMTYDEQSAAAFGDVAKKAGLSQEQAAAIASYGMQYRQDGHRRRVTHSADSLTPLWQKRRRGVTHWLRRCPDSRRC